jgi:signal peptidase II
VRPKQASILAISIIATIIIIDQVLKFWIKTNMFLGQEIPVFGNWFIIHFTENEGMAFGWSFGGNAGKLLLSIFRIAALFAIGYYLIKTTRNKPGKAQIIVLALIFAGALGNIIDSCFYGLIFNESSYYQTAVLLPENGGYAPFLYGKVVDMLYFPIINTTLPAWFPFGGGEEFRFFRPVFNIADSSISVGILIILLFQKRVFAKNEQKTVTEGS